MSTDPSAYHPILIDFRTFLNGGDDADRIDVGLGGECLDREVLRFRWEGELISGVFNERTTVKGAEQAREREHLIGSVNEREFHPDNTWRNPGWSLSLVCLLGRVTAQPRIIGPGE